MKSKMILLASLAVALVLGMSIAPAGAYFTDTTKASGGLEVNVTPEPDVQEWYAEATKHVTVTNEDDATTAVFARVRVFSGLPVEVTGDGWYGPVSEGDATWYYYGASQTALTEIAPGASSEELTVKITFPRVKSESQPDGSVYGDVHNVIVYYEATAVEYNKDGSTFADWSKVPGVEDNQGGN